MASSFFSSSPSSSFLLPESDPYSDAASSSSRARLAGEGDREVAIRGGGRRVCWVGFGAEISAVVGVVGRKKELRDP